MTLGNFFFAFLVLLSTPMTVTAYYTMTHCIKVHNNVFPYFTENDDSFYVKLEKLPALILFGILLWLGEVAVMIYFLWIKTNVILSTDSEMFLVPHYNGVFFEQHLILNRQRNKYTILDRLSGSKKDTVNSGEKRTIFICSTMYRENETEMEQMLSSIYRMACQHSESKRDTYESHIFFDGGVTKNEQHIDIIGDFGRQLLSLLERTLHVKVEEGKREKTPYGYCFTWNIGDNDSKKMRFSVHFKDNELVKAKKRWSQVMYMKYIIEHRIKTEEKQENTFILTTDADINFTPHSADVLLDMLDSNPQVGAVCARTHPKGYGIMYWYQTFEYAIGHWFQKPAEHILGCVLCSPGCFSVFRCSALKDVLEKYSSEAKTATEFLMKDMGEHRWLCTLLIKAGWRLEYCAISSDETYCPVEFGEFYKQRRRWIPSTVANLAMIIFAESMKITRGNDSVSILFILFQLVILFSTAISPATVIFVISRGLNEVFDINGTTAIIIITLLIIISVLYGVVCVASSPQTQIDIGKVLTFTFAIVMSIAFIGILKNVIESVVNRHDSATPVRPPICNDSLIIDYEACKKNILYIESLANTKSTFFIPVSTNTMYLAALVVTFLIAALLHPPEFYCIVHGIWYMIGLPSGYLFLLIYSAANLDNQSWGTREAKHGGEEDKGLLGWWIQLKIWLKRCAKCCVLYQGQELLEENQHSISLCKYIRLTL